MKVAIASDLHLEFGDLDFDNDQSADVLILSGDICVACDIAQRDPYNIMGPDYRSNRYHDFFQRCAARFPHVIYVLGNHEHYNGDVARTLAHLKDVLGYLDNLYILEREVKTIDGVTFVGGTLWTDMNQRDPLTLYHMTTMMNDFRIIKNSDRQISFRADVLRDKPPGMTDDEFLALPTTDRFKTVFKQREARFSPEDSVELHEQMLGYIQQVVQGSADQKFVVVGHHAPSRLSTHERYAKDTVMNGGYSSDLNEFIEAHPQIRLWTHGHTHHEFDYVIGNTRVICNPRGYHGYEEQASNFELKVIEL